MGWSEIKVKEADFFRWSNICKTEPSVDPVKARAPPIITEEKMKVDNTDKGDLQNAE